MTGVVGTTLVKMLVGLLVGVRRPGHVGCGMIVQVGVTERVTYLVAVTTVKGVLVRVSEGRITGLGVSETSEVAVVVLVTVTVRVIVVVGVSVRVRVGVFVMVDVRVAVVVAVGCQGSGGQSGPFPTVLVGGRYSVPEPNQEGALWKGCDAS